MVEGHNYVIFFLSTALGGLYYIRELWVHFVLIYMRSRSLRSLEPKLRTKAKYICVTDSDSSACNNAYEV